MAERQEFTAGRQEGQEGTAERLEGQAERLEGADRDLEALPARGTAELKAILEALIFASPEPLTAKALVKLLDTEPKEDVHAALSALKGDYERPGGLQLVEVAGGYQIVTRPDLHEWVRRLFHERTTQKLTVQGLETLAVIAYRQPVGRAEIEEIRGVSAGGVLRSLQERGLIEVVGRSEALGRPLLYGTAAMFLELLGLRDLADLPRAEERTIALRPHRPEPEGGEDAAAYVEAES